MYFDPIKTGCRLRELRNTYGLTQEYVAMKINVCHDHYNRMELGKRIPSLDLLCELTVLFDTSLDYLVFGKVQDTCLDYEKRKNDFDEVIERLKKMRDEV